VEILSPKRIIHGYDCGGGVWEIKNNCHTKVAALYYGTIGNEVGNAPFCGGTIISQRHIITARHCIQKMVCAEERVRAAANWWIQVSQYGWRADMDIPNGL
jgi:secreted trypsin-like serine protease